MCHLAVDLKKDLLRQGTYQHFLLEAVRGNIKVLIGGPPCRTNSVCRYMPLNEDVLGPKAMTLFVIATECSRAAGLPDPGFGLEQPEDPERWAGEEAGDQPRPSWDLQKVLPHFGAHQTGKLWSLSMTCRCCTMIRGPCCMQSGNLQRLQPT